MCGDHGTCSQLREYLQTMYLRPEEGTNDDEDDGEPSALFMMRRKLRNYLSWKSDFSEVSSTLFQENQKAINGSTTRKCRAVRPLANRRLISGGA